ncbi:phosphatidylglycerophosphate synthase [Bifidobacterium breve MCC 0305]|jgi:hypothetical protein|nr:phosphatidylglycerophosphate synthase [Bifidobacterium breve MCC 0305]KOA62543.1 phosphatidylglycerophosphate synthase [Bifidobacterium breve MCC 1604]
MHPIRHAVRTDAGVEGGARLQRVKCMRKRIGGMFATHGEPRKIRGGRSWRLTTIFAISYVTKVFKE